MREWVRFWALALVLVMPCVAAQDPPTAEDFQPAPDPSIPLPHPQAAIDNGGTEGAAEGATDNAWWGPIKEGLAQSAPVDGVNEPAAQSPMAKPPSLFSNAIRSMAWLCFLCGVIVLGGYLVRRFGKHTPLLAGHQYGTVLGKVHLSPRAAVYYVRSGGRVLAIGVTGQNMSLIAEFEAEAFEETEPEPSVPEPRTTVSPASFLQELRTASTSPKPDPGDDELTALRGDVQRLQRYLQDNLRESLD